MKRSMRNVISINLKKMTKTSSCITSTESIRTEHYIRRFDLTSDLIGIESNIISGGNHRPGTPIQAFAHMGRSGRLTRMQTIPSFDIVAFPF